MTSIVDSVVVKGMIQLGQSDQGEGEKKVKLFKKKEKYKIRFKHFYPTPIPVFRQVSKLKSVLLHRKGFLMVSIQIILQNHLTHFLEEPFTSPEFEH